MSASNLDHNQDSFSPQEFCRREGISKSMFYLLKKQGRAPQTYKLGRLTRIAATEATAWRKRMMEESQNQVTT